MNKECIVIAIWHTSQNALYLSKLWTGNFCALSKQGRISNGGKAPLDRIPLVCSGHHSHIQTKLETHLQKPWCERDLVIQGADIACQHVTEACLDYGSAVGTPFTTGVCCWTEIVKELWRGETGDVGNNGWTKGHTNCICPLWRNFLLVC